MLGLDFNRSVLKGHHPTHGSTLSDNSGLGAEKLYED